MNHMYLSSVFFSPVCWPVYFAGLRLLRQNKWVGPKEGSETDTEASHDWECGFACQQEGTCAFCFSKTHLKSLWQVFATDPPSATCLEVQWSTEDIPECTTSWTCRTHLDRARRRGLSRVPLPHHACSVRTHADTFLLIFWFVFFQLLTCLGVIFACVNGLFVVRPGSAIGWWSSIRHGKVGERTENRSKQQAGRLAWRISLGWQERGVVWVTVFCICVLYLK